MCVECVLEFKCCDLDDNDLVARNTKNKNNKENVSFDLSTIMPC